MYKCPVYEETVKRCATEDEWVGKWMWHHKNCTCGLVYLYNFKMVYQDDHVRAYWEAQGRLKVTWSTEFGMMLEYPKDIKDMFEINYPYR